MRTEVDERFPRASGTMIAWLLALSVFTASGVVPSVEADATESRGQNLVLLLIDGYGSALFNRTNERVQYGMRSLMAQGTHAQYMRPVFPTQSYPNWRSMATGLYTENHNFTSDFMYDEDWGITFERDEGSNDTDYRWWLGGPAPIWYTAGKHHINVHCYWFPECDKAHGDMIVQVPPSRRHSFANNNMNRDLFEEVSGVMKHIKRYQQMKQQLVLMRHGGVATALQTFGADHDAVNQAISVADVQVRKIQEEMESLGLFETTNLIVLSDFGLHPIDTEEQFFVDECLEDFSRVERVVNSLSFMMVYPREGEEDTVYFELNVCDQWAPLGDYDADDVPLVNVYRKADLPERLHWKMGPHVAPIVLITRPGTVLLTRQIPSTDVSEKHGREYKAIGGWDSDHPEMKAIFAARGPAFKVDHSIGPIETVDIYQLMCNILGIEPAHSHNGTWENVEGMLVEGWENRKVEPHVSAASGFSVLGTVLVLLVTCFCM
uniref:Ectonucleotide pyrophosphatase/phosphodiesterase family member 6 n=1 Tax=Steinernema glaseri TaxID=37863 RepID=A0A1I7Z445_9BILA